jgi:hypothetical protein
VTNVSSCLWQKHQSHQRKKELQVIIDRDIVCMEQPKGLIQDRKGKFVFMLENSLYGLLVPREIYKRLESFIVSQNFSKGRNDYTFYSKFIVLMLFVDDMKPKHG